MVADARNSGNWLQSIDVTLRSFQVFCWSCDAIRVLRNNDAPPFNKEAVASEINQRLGASVTGETVRVACENVALLAFGEKRYGSLIDFRAGLVKPQGEVWYLWAQHALETLPILRGAAHAPLRVAAAVTIAEYLLPKVRCDFYTKVCPSSDVGDVLAGGRADIAVTWADCASIDERRFREIRLAEFDSRYHVIYQPESPLAREVQIVEGRCMLFRKGLQGSTVVYPDIGAYHRLVDRLRPSQRPELAAPLGVVFQRVAEKGRDRIGLVPGYAWALKPMLRQHQLLSVELAMEPLEKPGLSVVVPLDQEAGVRDRIDNFMKSLQEALRRLASPNPWHFEPVTEGILRKIANPCHAYFFTTVHDGGFDPHWRQADVSFSVLNLNSGLEGKMALFSRDGTPPSPGEWDYKITAKITHKGRCLRVDGEPRQDNRNDRDGRDRRPAVTYLERWVIKPGLSSTCTCLAGSMIYPGATQNRTTCILTFTDPLPDSQDWDAIDRLLVDYPPLPQQRRRLR
jgi:hypothetical protein